MPQGLRDQIAMAGSGGDFLAKKSGVMRQRSRTPDALDMLIVDDETLDSDRMLGTLRVMFGYDVSVRRATSRHAALTLIESKHPDLILLDDILKPSDDGVKSIPAIRRAGYTGPILVISGQVTRSRRQALLAAGANDVIHKDDVDSVRLTEAIEKLLPKHA